MIEELNNLDESGILTRLIKAGLMSAKVETYRRIVNDYNEQCKKKKRKLDIIYMLADKYKVTDRTIFRAISSLK